jgi:hypothetical protein
MIAIHDVLKIIVKGPAPLQRRNRLDFGRALW